MSTFTSAKNLELVARAADVGTWDTPTNSNWSVVDAVLGQNAVIPLNNSNVALSANQAQCGQITFNSTLTGSVIITFPTSYTGPYIIQNLCTGTSAFTITLQTSAGGQVVGCPQGDSFNVINDGTNLKFHNIGRVGTYWDYAGSSVPNWVSACTAPPWINCDGTTFSGTTYPALATILGGTTLPDLRGVSRATLNQGTSRITTANSGIDGNTRFSIGGSELAQSHNHTGSGTTGAENAAHNHNYVAPAGNTTTGGGAFPCGGPIANVITATENQNHEHAYSFTTTTFGSGNSQNMPPTTISGITMIRGA